jgi:hypothetical protein
MRIAAALALGFRNGLGYAYVAGRRLPEQSQYDLGPVERLLSIPPITPRWD